jgi:hypothetical protein
MDELRQLIEETTLQEMAEAHLLKRGNSDSWNVTEKGWDWMMMLMRLVGIDMKDAKFEQVFAHARRMHAPVKH